MMEIKSIKNTNTKKHRFYLIKQNSCEDYSLGDGLHIDE